MLKMIVLVFFCFLAILLVSWTIYYLFSYFRTQKDGYIKLNPIPFSKEICVNGTTCSGKSTVAIEISKKYGLKYIDIDALHWGDNWTSKKSFGDDFINTLKSCNYKNFICDAVYSKILDKQVAHTNTVIILKFGFPVMIVRVIWRTFIRALLKKQVCGNNFESFFQSFCTKNSIIYWYFKAITSKDVSKKNSISYIKETFPNLNVLVFTSPYELSRFLKNDFEKLFIKNE